MVVSQANPVDPASDIEKPNTDWNKVEISFKKKDFQVTTEIRFVRAKKQLTRNLSSTNYHN